MGLAYVKFVFYLAVFSVSVKVLFTHINGMQETGRRNISLLYIILFSFLAMASLYLVIVNVPSAMYPHHDYLNQLVNK